MHYIANRHNPRYRIAVNHELRNSPTEPAALSLRAYLQEELAKRCHTNPQYSLRSFAQYLGIDHSTLSQIMRGKRALTADMIHRLAAPLKLSDTEIQVFVAYELVRATETPARTITMKRLIEDTLALISKPVHFQLIELARTGSFQPDSRWIARVLDTSVDEVNMAITRLMRLGFLRFVDANSWECLLRAEVSTHDQFISLAATRLSEQLQNI
jgi:uncharacterized protein (TIGR02147 family)